MVFPATGTCSGSSPAGGSRSRTNFWARSICGIPDERPCESGARTGRTERAGRELRFARRPPNGFTCTVHHLEPKVGGTFKMSFRNFTTGNGHSFGGEYLELVPGERLRYTDRFDV